MARVVVFGAGGGIGGSICEALLQRSDIDLVACIRQWSSAVRLARRGTNIVKVDLEDIEAVSQIVSGADVVVNAAMLPPAREATLVSALYSAAASAGVHRFVQFSSAVVYGNATGDVTEATALSPTGDYARGKADMERRLLEAAVPSAPQLFILRPSIVYGPFADFWTVRYVERVSKGRWRSLGAAGSGTCNLVHAHDVARVVIAAATADVEPGAHVFNVNGPGTVTWNDYLEQLGNALGATDRVIPNLAWFRTLAVTAEIMRKAARWSPLRSFYRRSKGTTRAVFTGAQGVTKLYPQSGELRLLRQKVNYKSVKVTSVLRVSPSISLNDGLRQSVAWCRIHGIC